MFLSYIDESGDTGLNNSPTSYFVLSAIVINEKNWKNTLSEFVEFRRELKKRYNLLMKEEIHASEFVSGNPSLKNLIAKNDRIDILKKCLKWLNSREELSIITVRCKKNQTKNIDVFEYTWEKLIQRIENTLKSKNFPGQSEIEKGLIIADNTNKEKLTILLRKMRHYNIVPSNYLLRASHGNRNLTLENIIEDPIFRNSRNSYFHQLADVVVYFARQYYEPNRICKKKGLRTFYVTFLGDVTNKSATNYLTPNKIVEI